jgi:hypothetical protein
LTIGKTDYDRETEKESTAPLPKPPAFPRPDTLVLLSDTARSGFRVFIDRATLEVTPHAEVRYVVVARSGTGVDNVRFEGMRCPSAELRTYAFGRADGTWGGKPSDWQPVAKSLQPWHRALYLDYFCPQKNPIGSAAEGVRALEQGGHPFAKGFSGDALLGK